ncbi:hypothetical protein NEOKW01_1614 [Nematocida sp. AWRm80]|nr:hypothetical protein NEOKW01_1614 [Nematocida sp. AWRm80]
MIFDNVEDVDSLFFASNTAFDSVMSIHSLANEFDASLEGMFRGEYRHVLGLFYEFINYTPFVSKNIIEQFLRKTLLSNNITMEYVYWYNDDKITMPVENIYTLLQTQRLDTLVKNCMIAIKERQSKNLSLYKPAT